jgi:hypothetical protein
MNIPLSSVWLGLNLLGGLLAIIGNGFYPIVTEQEKRTQLAKDAWTILRPELARNKQLAIEMQSELDKGVVDPRKFEVYAWETISKGGMLQGLPAEDIRNLLLVYSICYQANEVNTELNDSTTGTRSVFTNKTELQQLFGNSLRMSLAKLSPAIDKVDPKQ